MQLPTVGTLKNRLKKRYNDIIDEEFELMNDLKSMEFEEKEATRYKIKCLQIEAREIDLVLNPVKPEYLNR